MDPNAALARIRELTDLDSMNLDQHYELAELVKDLDEWLSKGGFPPEAWRGSSVATREERYRPLPERAFPPAHGQGARF